MKYFTITVLAVSMLYFGCSNKTAVRTSPTSVTTTTTTTTTPTPPAPPVAPTPKVQDEKRQYSTPGEITFFAANERYSAQGTFNEWKFTNVAMEEGKIETLQGSIEIDLTSIWEKSAKLTEHLKAYDYFDVAKYTTATIEIHDIHVHGESEGHAQMVLKMRGFEQQLDASFQILNKDPLTISGDAFVDRSIFKIGEDNKDVPNEIQVTFNTIIPL